MSTDAAFTEADLKLFEANDEKPVTTVPPFGDRSRIDLISGHDIEQSQIVSRVGQVPFLTINSLPDWTVPKGTTLMLRLDGARAGDRFELTLGRKRILQSCSDALVFRALLAAHRMSAKITIELRDAAGGVVQSSEDYITPDHPGGRDVSLHKPLLATFARAADAATLTVSVEIDRADEASVVPPYLFISNPQLHPTTQSEGPAPYVLGASQAGTQEFMAKLNPYVVGASSVVVKDQIITLPERPRAGFSDPTFSGRSLHVNATEDGVYTLYVDGAYVSDAHLGIGRGSVLLPEFLLDGGIHHVAIRDRHGLFVLYETYEAFPAVMTSYDIICRETRSPLPYRLAQQASHRYTSLGRAVAKISDKGEAEQLAHAHDVVTKGVGFLTKRDYRPLAFKSYTAPLVSIVIPAHNKFNITYSCLCALLLAANEATFEVVVVDDGSSDETARLGDLVSGITVIHNEMPQRFIRACNEGVAACRGEYVVLLNNDTEPTAGWLDELIEPFKRFDDVGLTGSKLVYPDGRLQDAGGIVWRSGNPWNYGRGANPFEPRFSYTRQADYLSGAAMMVRKSVWDEIGGLSSYLEPMYFEDTDFAFKVRAAGYKTMFAPLSLVYHYEGGTSGTEIISGMKRYQEVNRPKFKQRWASAYRSAGEEGQNVDIEKDRGIVGRVAFIDYATPRPDRDAGSYAAIEEIKLVQSLGFKVTFVPDNVTYLGHYTDELSRQGVETIHAPFAISVADFLEKRAAEFDVFYITRYQIAAKYIDMIRRLAPRAKILFMNADLHFLRELRSAIESKDDTRMAGVARIRDDELAVMRKADVTLSYNDVEHSVIVSHALNAVKVVRAPWVVRASETIAPLAGREGFSFLGSYGHPPNVQAVEWFTEAVLPLVLSQRPGEVFHIYGSAMGANIRALESDNVTAHGFAEDLADVYDRHRVFIAPLRSGAGIKGKVLGALARGVPCVLSPVAAEGTGLRNGYDCLIAEDPSMWAEHIVSLLTKDELWMKLSTNGRDFVKESFSVQRGQQIMRKAFQAADIYFTL
ncbi:glycosyltransferase [Aurantimonas sp. 22II-16-19i]|uniref:glycosyltransferase n=1 Tax=Aurantimonas sp. 22II-16-19i TaxID=1317114 RepID=UPI0009F7FFE8|nr:glycosyltransferase [Aurantimonas sp. 22II-16-19i]ORE97477.1 glycosyltransferase [Aurantimonas sp. 22II-16-19i]